MSEQGQKPLEVRQEPSPRPRPVALDIPVLEGLPKIVKLASPGKEPLESRLEAARVRREVGGCDNFHPGGPAVRCVLPPCSCMVGPGF